MSRLGDEMTLTQWDDLTQCGVALGKWVCILAKSSQCLPRLTL
jgi:hypothetical protein